VFSREDAMAKVALYVRVSTDQQDTARQRAELDAWAQRAEHAIVAVYEDYASGAKGADRRPGFAAMLKAAARREFAVLAVWSVDRLARSMVHLLTVVDELKATNVDLYIHGSGLDTRTPTGRAMFLMSGIFAELERELIRARVKSGLDRAKMAGKRLGRPALRADLGDRARDALRAGRSIRAVAAEVGISVGAVHRFRTELVTLGQLA
jgi:DNA invertase Pin-like site-specific DNA recombinase